MNDQLLRQIAADVTDLKVTSAKQEVNLAEHMRRTAAAETQVEELKRFVSEVRTHIRGIRWLGGAVVVAIGVAKTLGIL